MRVLATLSCKDTFTFVLCKANMWEAEAPGEFCRYNYDFIDALHGDQFIYIYMYIYQADCNIMLNPAILDA